MRPLGLVFAVLLLALRVAGEEPAEVTTVIVPVVGSVVGGNGVTWKTNLELVNDSGSEVIVALEPVGFDDRIIIESIEPGGVRVYHDLVAAAFGLDGSLIPLAIRTSGRRSVLVRASAYGFRGEETFPPLPIPVNYSYGQPPSRVLSGLAFSSDYRTNIGLANLGTSSAELVLGLQRIAGRTIAVRRMTLAPNTLEHIAIQALFPLITRGSDFSVIVETSAPDTHIYASVIENATHVARFVQPATTRPTLPRRTR